jgi:glycerophosphoryl diester phosphodiesterase
VQGHRGASGLAPENTLAAFRRAIELGTDGVELDLQVSRDGAVVILHDDTLERTTDRPGRIADLPLAEIRLADAGGKFSPAFRGERVPTLAELIALVAAEATERFRLNLEIKFADGREGQPPDIEERVLAILRETDFVGRVTVQSFHHPSPAKMKRLEPAIPTGVLVGQQNPVADPVAAVRLHGADYFAPNFRLVTAGMVTALHEAGIPAVVWTVNDPAEMRRLIALGVGALFGDAIISDYPDRLLALLAGR